MSDRIARWFGWLTDRSLADAIVGDLVEERHRRSARSGAAASFWFWRQVLALSVYMITRRTGEILRGLWRWTMRPGVLKVSAAECRYAARSLWHARWYSLGAIGVIALATALATTVFAVVDGVLFKPLPYPRSSELVSIEPAYRQERSGSWSAVSAADVTGWSQAMPDVAFTAFRLSSNARFEEVNDSPLGVAEVQANFFDTIGVPPLAGGFSQDWFPEASSLNPTIISYELWQTRFGGAPDIVGHTIVRGSASMQIVGVMPRGFVFPGRINAQVLMPLVLSPAQRVSRGSRQYEVIARLPSAEMRDAITARLGAAMVEAAKSLPPLPPPPPGMRYANAEPFDRAILHPLDERLAARARPLFLSVFLAAGALVLLGCVNVSGLMAARGLDRGRELSLRRALGAEGGDIVRLVMIEAAALVGAGTIAGLAAVRPLLALVVRLLPRDLTLLKTPAVDWRVAAFSASLMCVAAVGISLWPIRRGLRTGDGATHLETGRVSTRARTLGRFAVVSSQVAIAFALTIGAVLLVGSLVRLWQDDIGIQPDHVFAVETRVPAAMTAADPTVIDAIVDRLLERTRALPGVTYAGATDAPLFRNTTWADLGVTPPPGAKHVSTSIHGITSGFFDVVRPRLIAGQLPSDAELDAGRQVIVVSESTAKAYWPSESPIGQTLSVSGGPTPLLFTVVAVVGDARFAAWDDLHALPVYLPARTLARGISPNLLIRTSQPASALFSEIQTFLSAEGPDVRAIRAQTLNDMLADSVRPRRFQSWLFGSFGVAALAIVAVGILGVMAMTTARRTREIGIRVTLGATRAGVIRLLVAEQLAAVAIGVVAGGAIAAWAVTFVKSYLYQLTVYDVRLWAIATLLIVVTAAMGTLIPSLRASRVDPVTALRVE